MILLSHIKRLRNSPFVCNLATLSFGTIVSQIIPIVATVVLSRLYNPGEMGEWGVFSSYAAIFAIIGCLRYDSAIVKANNQTEAYHLTFITVFFATVFSLFLFVFFSFISLVGYDIGIKTSTLLLLPIYVLSLLLVQSLSNLATFLGMFKLIATNSINRSISQTGSRILLGFVKFNRQGMIIGAIIGNTISLVTLIRSLAISRFWDSFDRKRAYLLIKVNKDFPIYDLPGNLLNSVSSHCPPILLSYFFVDSVVGFFSMAQSLLFIPMSFVGSSVSQLYYKDAGKLSNRGDSISALTKRLFMLMYTLAFIFMSVLIFCNDWFFGMILGNKWNDVGKYVVMLSPWLLLVTAISPLSTVFYVKGKQSVNMYLNAFGLFLRVISIILVSFLYNSSDLAILTFGITSSLFCAIQGFYILKYGEVSFSKKDIYTIVSISCIFSALYIWKITTFFIGV